MKQKKMRIRLVNAVLKLFVCLALLILFGSRIPVQAEKGEEREEENREENELEKIEFQEPEILYPAPNGKNGYYITCPEITIIHKERRTVTKYELLNADEKIETGSLELDQAMEEGMTEILLKDVLKEGENILKVWTEQKQEEVIEGVEPSDAVDSEENSLGDTDEDNPVGYDLFSAEFRFCIDTKIPEPIRFSYNCPAENDVLFSNFPLEISVRSSDGGSGVDAVYYQTSAGDNGVISGESGSITLNLPFSGIVEAYAVDKAGNQSETVRSKKLLCENISPTIQIQAEGDEEVWSREPVPVHVTVQDPLPSSGIRSFKCYCNGKVVVRKDGEMNGTGVTGMEADFVIDEMSEGGSGIAVIVEVLDWAGNFRTENRVFYLDWDAPKIALEGVHDRMITGQAVQADVKITDENFLRYQRMEIWRTAPGETQKLLEEQTENAVELGGHIETGWKVCLEEDGIYEINLVAEDYAGNRSETAYQVVVDRTDPLIRYVSQMQGVYVPYFQWNYGADEMIQDFTEYTYEILLDGMRYTAGMRIREEGVKLLQVKAVDAAGNIATAEAIFHIDHTPPLIRIYDVADGKCYTEEVDLGISVDGAGDYLKEITVNEERMKLGTESQVFQQTFIEAGEYAVEILAEDLAGNQAAETVSFRMEEKGTIGKTILKPVTKIMRQETKGENSKAATEDSGWKHNGETGVLIAGIGMILVVLCRKMRKRY